MVQQYPKVAVVILNWNGRDYLERFLPTVCATDYPHLDVYVVDNASADDSVGFVRRNFPHVSVIEHSVNNGFAGGYNDGLREVEADYYVLLNQDVAVEKDWIGPIIALMEDRPEIAACQPKILSHAQPEYFEYAGAAGGWIDRWGYPFCRGRIFDTLEKDEGQYDLARPVFWASGAALFVRAKLYRQAGGLDPFFFAHMEEIDLCWRLQRLGYQVWCCPQSVVYHVGGGSLPRGNARKTFLNYRNNLLMLHKNLRGMERFYTLLIRFMLDGIAGMKSLVEGRPRDLLAILKSHGAYYRWWLSGDWKKGMGKPIPTPPLRSGRLQGVYPHSLVWQYFVRKTRKFSDLEFPGK